MSSFGKYSAYYDLLYRDKDYVAEARYVAKEIRAAAPNARDILELGSGTGRHGCHLAEMGFDVHGIERSSEMVAIAQAKVAEMSVPESGSFSCEVGDICTAKLDRTFDAVISLFHVMSYQASDEALRAAFGMTAAHLRPRGAFLFDVWYGPAVLAQQPSYQVKEAIDERHHVRRITRPTLDAERQTVNVIFDLECRDRATGAIERFSEEHVMRYVFPEEIERLARNSGLYCVKSEEFLTGLPASTSTWSVAYLLRKDEPENAVA